MRAMNTASPLPVAATFFGPQVVRAAFVMAVFGWGVGFYGPPIYLHAVMQRTGWPLVQVSSIVTLHFLAGVLVIAWLPRLHQRFGLPAMVTAGALLTAVGVFGWAVAEQPWQLVLAALTSGIGWVNLGAVTVNAVVARWHQRTRPLALARAYNGASIGGVLFAPLWVALIAQLGFAMAALLVGSSMVVAMALLARLVFAKTPQELGQRIDGEGAAPGSPAVPSTPAAGAAGVASTTATGTASATAAAAAAAAASATAASPSESAISPLPGSALWRNRSFQTLAAGMALGLFAQVGLLAHLFSLLVPRLGAGTASWVMGAATACAIAGRSVAARLMMRLGGRRHMAAASYALQAIGALVLAAAGTAELPAVLLGTLLFGLGIGNATSLPPLIAQNDFAAADVPRVVALIVAMAQAGYAFAPAIFGALLEWASAPGQGVALFITTAGLQCLAGVALLTGARRHITVPNQSG